MYWSSSWDHILSLHMIVSGSMSIFLSYTTAHLPPFSYLIGSSLVSSSRSCLSKFSRICSASALSLFKQRGISQPHVAALHARRNQAKVQAGA